VYTPREAAGDCASPPSSCNSASRAALECLAVELRLLPAVSRETRGQRLVEILPRPVAPRQSMMW
jgi:hypothetical protein